MGRKAKSAKLQLLDGNPNRLTKEELDRRIAAEEKLKGKCDKLFAPEWLDTEGEKCFNFVVEQLKELDIICNLDLFSVAIYSDTYSNIINLKKIINRDGLVIDGKPNPLLKRQETLSGTLRMFGNDLGLSPTSRNKIAINMPVEDFEEDW